MDVEPSKQDTPDLVSGYDVKPAASKSNDLSK